MLITLHKYGPNGTSPLYLVAEEIQGISYGQDYTELTMIFGNVVTVEESPREILERLQVLLPDRWGDTGG